MCSKIYFKLYNNLTSVTYSNSIQQLLSDNFKNGPHMLNVYTSLLFTCMLTHAIPPSVLLLSCIASIPKKRGNLSDSSIHRASLYK